MATCRFCGEFDNDDRMVRYSTRHLAHFSCYLDRKPLSDLKPWKIRTFPYKLLKERGLLDEAMKLAPDDPA